MDMPYISSAPARLTGNYSSETVPMDMCSVDVDEITIKLPKRCFLMKPQKGHIVHCKFGNYKIQQFVGSGGYATVYKAETDPNGPTVAVKVAKILHGSTNLSKSMYIEELTALNYLMEEDHENIVKILDISLTHCVFVMEYINGCNLYELAVGKERHDWEKDEAGCIIVITGLFHGLEYLQRVNIIHRDLNGCNILLNGDVKSSNFVVKLADFGRAVHIGQTREIEVETDKCSPYPYCAPENSREDFPKGYKIDIWALGVNLYLMLKGDQAYRMFTMYYHQYDLVNLALLANKIGEESPHVLAMEEIIRETVVFDPSQRSSLRELLRIPFVRRHYERTKKSVFPRDPQLCFSVSF